MVKEFKNKTSSFLIATSFVVFIILATNVSFSALIMWTILMFYLWLFVSIYIKDFSIQKTTLYLSCLGVFFSITMFFSFGVEKVPFPQGAVVFNSTEITYSLLLFFISSLPLFVFYNENTFLNKKAAKKAEQKEEWEEASLEDV